MSDKNETQEGMLSFKNSNIYIKTSDGTEHKITEDHYVEILQQYNSESSTYIALNQQYSDGLWYFDIIDFQYKSELPARFRIAKAGERKKNGTLRIEKNKLYIDLWDNTALQIEKKSNIELNLEDGFSKMRWKNVRVDYNDSKNKWFFYDSSEHEHILQDKHKNFNGELEHNQLSRITY